MKYRPKVFGYGLSIVVGVAALAAILSGVYPAQAARQKTQHRDANDRRHRME